MAMALWARRNGRQKLGRIDWGEVAKLFELDGGTTEMDANGRRVFVYKGQRVSETKLGDGAKSVKKRINALLKTAP